MKKLFLPLFVFILFSCGTEKPTNEIKKDSVPQKDTNTVSTNKNSTPSFTPVVCKNDSLDELAQMIAAMKPGNPKVLGDVFSSKAFEEFQNGFDKKWREYDSSRLTLLEKFRSEDLSNSVGETKTLFYPFSGPDFLYANAFFPEADTYILMGLEPVGTRPLYDQTAAAKDSTTRYFAKVKPALFTILNFSFFRTQGMKKDLRNEELDGTLHLLLLFIKRTGHDICAINPVNIDSSGNIRMMESFPALAKKPLNNRGIEIKFTTKEGKPKTLYYFSTNLEDSNLKRNKNLLNYFAKMGDVNTYLKGASYLMHEKYFSEIRNTIFAHSQRITQDDSGIKFAYFARSGFKWDYTFYGKYTKPISLFSYSFQKDLDSLWKTIGSKDIGFGIGYNFRDKNSNLMVARKGESIPIPPDLSPEKTVTKEKTSKGATKSLKASTDSNSPGEKMPVKKSKH